MTLPRLNYDLAFGEMFDVGLEHYGEFIVNRDFAAYLLAGGMSKVDGRPGRLVPVVEYENARQLRWVYDDAA